MSTYMFGLDQTPRVSGVLGSTHHQVGNCNIRRQKMHFLYVKVLKVFPKAFLKKAKYISIYKIYILYNKGLCYVSPGFSCDVDRKVLPDFFLCTFSCHYHKLWKSAKLFYFYLYCTLYTYVWDIWIKFCVIVVQKCLKIGKQIAGNFLNLHL